MFSKNSSLPTTVIFPAFEVNIFYLLRFIVFISQLSLFWLPLPNPAPLPRPRNPEKKVYKSPQMPANKRTSSPAQF
jgi:hypothetical protein